MVQFSRLVKAGRSSMRSGSDSWFYGLLDILRQGKSRRLLEDLHLTFATLSRWKGKGIFILREKKDERCATG